MSNFDNPLVTVYILNHNYAAYVEKAIESVLIQSFTDFEVLVIDDGSTDDSRSVIEKYASHPKITTIFQNNQGLNVTNNIALRAARGKYIMRLDADDYLHQNALELLEREFQMDQKLGMVFPDYYLVSKDGEILEIAHRHDFSEVELLDQPAHGACTMVRREYLESIGGYDEDFRCQDGWDIWLRFIEQYKVKNVNLPLFYYRQHGNNLTKNEERLLYTRADILSKRTNDKSEYKGALAVIPVRGESLDPHSTPLKYLGKKRLIEWTVDATFEAESIAHVVVTTPSREIREFIESRYQGSVITLDREINLAMPNTSLDKTINDTLAKLQDKVEDGLDVFILNIETPFKKPKYIDMAYSVLKYFGVDKVISVRPESDEFLQHDGKGLVPVRKSQTLRLEREEIYRKAGGIQLIRAPSSLDQNSAEIKQGHIIIDEEAAINVISKWSWELASLIADKKHVAKEESSSHIILKEERLVSK